MPRSVLSQLLSISCSEPQATAPNSYAISLDNRTRLLRTSRNLDWFFMDDLAFAGRKTQKCVNPSATAPAGSLAVCNYVKSEPANTLSSREDSSLISIRVIASRRPLVSAAVTRAYATIQDSNE